MKNRRFPFSMNRFKYKKDPYYVVKIKHCISASLSYSAITGCVLYTVAIIYHARAVSSLEIIIPISKYNGLIFTFKQ